ncbi:cytochrome P450 [Flammula alnicola]|nr:cytochrome P450 [Flammula alnicola]
MELPPGLVYLLRLFPYFAIPSAAVYFCLRLTQEYQPSFGIPSWLVIVASVLARPLLFTFNFYYAKWANKRAAAAHGARLPPVIQESSFSVIPKMASSTRNGYPSDMMFQWSQTYGNTFQLELLNTTLVVTTEPKHIKAILAMQFDAFEKGPTFFMQMGSLFGTGVFNADGEMWKFHRSMTRPFFTRERISDFEIYDRNCDLSLVTAKKRLAEGFSLDFQDLASRFTLDSATEFLFGNNVGSLLAGIPYPASATERTPRSFYDHPSTVFVKAFTEGQVLSVCRLGYGDDWPLLELWGDRVKPLRKIMDGFTEPVMNEALARRERELQGGGDSKSDEDVTLLAHLVRHTQDPKILKDELINLLIAGRDTTMCLLTFSFYMLTQHPDIEQRLRQEIFEKVGPTGSPTYDQMREMKYMRAFLNEVLRLYPPVPADTRTTNRAVILPAVQTGTQPFYVPAHTSCIYNIINMQRRTDLWGPDALKFDPDRFIDERLHKYLVPNPFIFCPFNAGPRICLGQQFAYHEATFFLVRLLQQFTEFTLDDSTNAPPPVEWASGEGLKATEKIFPLAHLTMYVKDGLWVRMKELKSG